MKWFEFFHGASVSNGHATSFAQLQVRRNAGCRFENETDPFRFREKDNETNAATMLAFLEGPSGRHASLKPQVASPTIATPAVLAGHEMVDGLPICLWYVCHTGLVGRVATPTAKTTRNARDSPSVGPIATYISGLLLSTAAEDEHRADQDEEKESCFHLMLVPCLIAGRMLAFLLITYQ
jgi:hypothetical protein